MKRTSARELLMQLFYQMEVQNDYSDEAKLRFLDLNYPDGEYKNQSGYITDVCSAFRDNRSEIDALIEKYAHGWKLSRIAKVDLSVMRIAVTEGAFLPEDKKTPVGAAINEAVKTVKKYGTDDSGKFVNGILGEIFRNL